MDDLLPSYESAIHQNPWALVARYLPSETLCSAALVCRTFHEIVTPQLWGNPASHFGAQNDTVYVALTRFKRILPYVRPFVRELTHTLELPPAHAEIYGGPHAEWLRDCLEYLPRLQCLLVNGLPFFDHASLLCLRHASLRRKSSHPADYPVFGLRLLDASGCTNTTSTGLAEALCHFPSLVSLDLSRTPAAKDAAVLSKLKFLSNLRLLNLKGLGLKDADFENVAVAIATRVRSLDVSDNHLTDASARTLLHHCLKEEAIESHTVRGPLPPVEHGRLDGEVDPLVSENVAGHVRRKLTGGFVGSLAIETSRDVGITHLYLSKNTMTVEGISGLLRSKRLQVLDIGILPAVMDRLYPIAAASNDIELPGVSKLTPVLAEYASAKLKYLRVNYEIITEDGPTDAGVPPRAELDGDTGSHAHLHAQELDATEPPMSELDSVDTIVVEAPGDASYPVELPGCAPPSLAQKEVTPLKMPSEVVVLPPEIEVVTEPQEVKRGAAYAPEPVWIDSPPASINPFLEHDGLHAPSADGTALLSPLSQTSPIEEGKQTTLPSTARNRSRHNSTYYVENRRARIELRQAQENRLHPNMLPHVHTLVLTDVPTSTVNKKVIDRLIQYVKDAAEEAAIARQRAQHTYALPPGRSRAVAEREHAYGLFALRRIVFEMAPPQVAPKKISSSWRAYPTKSSTEDADSEAFWNAAANDFSFFGEEECGLPSVEPGRTLPLAAMSGLEVAPERHVAPLSALREAEGQPQAALDVVDEIAKFRKDRTTAYNNLLQMGDTDPDVEGYWPGAVTVIRKPVNQEEGELDCYGNRYESGWFYR
ncbi:hypothetical protein CC86DRAFT_328861 [Ophiobolus disseminans]|uniref:F-box domain-containing protein n=1 Tax=Ophiobolus disseminans TaxID=1469910 RepID=A0A6A6ZRT0_9PLEO|nr:hypothetical protein CC86DRAFT_328861 [Ophiobolus disseminans]